MQCNDTSEYISILFAVCKIHTCSLICVVWNNTMDRTRTTRCTPWNLLFPCVEKFGKGFFSCSYGHMRFLEKRSHICLAMRRSNKRVRHNDTTVLPPPVSTSSTSASASTILQTIRRRWITTPVAAFPSNVQIVAHDSVKDIVVVLVGSTLYWIWTGSLSELLFAAFGMLPNYMANINIADIEHGLHSFSFIQKQTKPANMTTSTISSSSSSISTTTAVENSNDNSMGCSKIFLRRVERRAVCMQYTIVIVPSMIQKKCTLEGLQSEIARHCPNVVSPKQLQFESVLTSVPSKQQFQEDEEFYNFKRKQQHQHSHHQSHSSHLRQFRQSRPSSSSSSARRKTSSHHNSTNFKTNEMTNQQQQFVRHQQNPVVFDDDDGCGEYSDVEIETYLNSECR